MARAGAHSNRGSQTALHSRVISCESWRRQRRFTTSERMERLRAADERAASGQQTAVPRTVRVRGCWSCHGAGLCTHDSPWPQVAQTRQAKQSRKRDKLERQRLVDTDDVRTYRFAAPPTPQPNPVLAQSEDATRLRPSKDEFPASPGRTPTTNGAPAGLTGRRRLNISCHLILDLQHRDSQQHHGKPNRHGGRGRLAGCNPRKRGMLHTPFAAGRDCGRRRTSVYPNNSASDRCCDAREK
jgi:hypothetical protein